MANIKSAIKRVKTSEKARIRNAAAKSAMRTVIKKAEVALLAKSDDAKVLFMEASKQLDKAASSGIIHKNAAARKKSRLAKRANAL